MPFLCRAVEPHAPAGHRPWLKLSGRRSGLPARSQNGPALGAALSPRWAERADRSKLKATGPAQAHPQSAGAPGQGAAPQALDNGPDCRPARNHPRDGLAYPAAPRPQPPQCARAGRAAAALPARPAEGSAASRHQKARPLSPARPSRTCTRRCATTPASESPSAACSPTTGPAIARRLSRELAASSACAIAARAPIARASTARPSASSRRRYGSGPTPFATATPTSAAHPPSGLAAGVGQARDPHLRL